MERYCYRSTFFTVVKKFNNSTEIEPGLISVRDQNLVTKLVVPLDKVSRPLIVGKSDLEFIIIT